MTEGLSHLPSETMQALIKGDPAERITASAPRVLITRLHGEEELAALVEHHIRTQRDDLTESVDYICGNPLAAAQGLRAQSPLDDLNRSFNLSADHPRYDSPERTLADSLLPRARTYEYVLDIHTSETDCGRFFIAANPHHPAVETIIGCSTIDTVLVMPPPITAPSLIGNVPSSISIEYNDHLGSQPEAVEEVITIIDGLIQGEPKVQSRERALYYVDHAVPKTKDPGDVTNFELCAEGYYPVLFGEGPKSYRNDPSKNYLGFAAINREIVVL